MEDFYSKLVDLYAGRELPGEIEADLEARATKDPELAHDMYTLRHSVDALKAQAGDVEMTEESYQRILMKLYSRGAELQTAPEPAHLQFYLPIQG